MSADMAEQVAAAESLAGVELHEWQRKVLTTYMDSIGETQRRLADYYRTTWWPMAEQLLAAFDAYTAAVREAEQRRARLRRLHHAYHLRRKGKW